MKLLVESEKLNVIQEDVGGEKQYFLEGVFLQTNIENRNGRIYPLDIVKKEVERYKQEYINSKRSFGELNHPVGADNTPQINLDRVSHLITDIWQDGDYFKARAKILDTPYGNIVKTYIKEGCQLGVSSRALGSVKRVNGVDVVQNDFRLITAGDIVWEPSAQAAFPTGLVEDVDWVFDETTGEYVRHYSDEYRTQCQLEEFKNLLENQKTNLSNQNRN